MNREEKRELMRVLKRRGFEYIRIRYCSEEVFSVGKEWRLGCAKDVPRRIETAWAKMKRAQRNDEMPF